MTRPRSASIDNSTRYTATLPGELFERLKKAAAADNRSPSSWMVPYLEAAVDEWERRKTEVDPLYSTRKYLQPSEGESAIVDENKELSQVVAYIKTLAASQETLTKQVQLLIDSSDSIDKKQLEKLTKPSGGGGGDSEANFDQSPGPHFRTASPPKEP
ncbi:MAG: hypothetical protein R3F07_03915 [Opitutaceae bacterium]